MSSIIPGQTIAGQFYIVGELSTNHSQGSQVCPEDIKAKHEQAKRDGRRTSTNIEPANLNNRFEMEPDSSTPPSSPRTRVCPQQEFFYKERKRSSIE